MGEIRWDAVVAIDPSVQKTGLASFDIRNGRYYSKLVDTRMKRGQPAATDPGRLAGICEVAVHFVDGVASRRFGDKVLLVIEGHAGQRGNGLVNVALHWMLRAAIGKAFPVSTLVIAPATLKKFATGDGKAEKGTIGAQITRRWGACLPDGTTEDVLEALALLQLGRCWIDTSNGAAGDWPQFQRDIAFTARVSKGEAVPREVEEDSLSMRVGVRSVIAAGLGKEPRKAA